MNPSLTYLADSIFIEALAKEDKIIARGSDGVFGSVVDGVKNYIASKFDKSRPIASIMSFLGRGLLYSMGFKWMSLLYAGAEAFGFDWTSFWSEVGKRITSFIKGLRGKKASEQDASSKVDEIVSSAVNSHFSGEFDPSKVNVKDVLSLQALSLELKRNTFIKNAASTSFYRSKLAGFFIRTISWLVKTALISLGFVAAAGAVSGLVGKKKKDRETREPAQKQEVSKEPVYSLKMSPSAPPELFDVHRNDMSNAWIEAGNIDNIDETISNWILAIFPQLSKKIDDIKNSEPFKDVKSAFLERNRFARGTGLISIPRPYERKSDIVSFIVNEYMK